MDDFTPGGQPPPDSPPPSDAEAFLRGLRPLPFTSSNVATAEYDPAARELTLTFLKGDGRPYIYPGMDEGTARSFAEAGSKGSWTHHNLRKVRWPFRRS